MEILRTITEVAQGKPAAFQRSTKWASVRQLFVKSHPKCMACGCRVLRLLNVHHVRPFHLFPELELNPHNLITLCEGAGCNCHFAFGHLLNWRAYNLDVAADATRFHYAVKHRLSGL